MKARGSCVHASRAVWVGKWWKRGSFSQLTAPFGILHLLHHERPESFSTPSYSYQAWRNCHIPANINNDSVRILVWIHLAPRLPLLPLLVHRGTVDFYARQINWCWHFDASWDAKGKQDNAELRIDLKRTFWILISYLLKEQMHLGKCINRHTLLAHSVLNNIQSLRVSK